MDFRSLLEESRQVNSQLKNQASSGAESLSLSASRFIPPLNRTLEQIENQSKRFAMEHSSNVSSNKGQFLLAKEGAFHPEKLESQIKELPRLSDTFEPQCPISETDLEAHLIHDEELLVLSLLEEARKESFKEMETKSLKAMKLEWDSQKKTLLEDIVMLSGKPTIHSQTSAATATPGPQTPASKGIFSVGTTLRMNPRMHQYANVISRLNDARSRKAPFNLLSSMTEVCAPESSVDQTGNCWAMVSSILARDNAQPLERSFAESYKQSWESGQSVALRQRFIYGGRRYLESQLFRFIEKTISQQPREAAMGGRPGVYEKIKGYLNIRLKQYGRWDSTIEIANDTPIWAIIFYLIRCGFWDDAVATAIKFEKYFDREDPNFVTYLKAYVENSDDYRLPKHLRNQIIMEYTQKTRQQADRFKLAIYKVLGRCDLSRKTLNDVIATKEDYIWLQLSLIRETPELDFSTDSYCLADLQALLIKFGPEHFSAKNSNPLNYFQVLLLCFQFEKAVAYLYEFEQHRVDAVHFAIAFAYLGALLHFDQPDTFSVELVKTEGGRCKIQLSRLLTTYAKYFAKSDPSVAFHYLFLLTLPQNRDYDAYCHSQICSLVLETKDYGFYLGTFNADETKAPGFIEKYLGLMNLQDEKEFLKSIVLQAAQMCESEGKVQDALNLYNLSHDYDAVLGLLARKMSENLFGSSDALEFYKQHCISILQYYDNRNVEKSKMATCQMLLKLSDFLRLHGELKYEAALSCMEDINIIPLDGDARATSRMAESFSHMDECISRHVGDIIVCLMTCIAKLFEGYKNSPYYDAAKQSKMQSLSKKARSLASFSGMIPLRLPQEVFAKLNRMAVPLN